MKLYIPNMPAYCGPKMILKPFQDRDNIHIWIVDSEGHKILATPLLTISPKGVEVQRLSEGAVALVQNMFPSSASAFGLFGLKTSNFDMKKEFEKLLRLEFPAEPKKPRKAKRASAKRKR